MFVVTAFSAVRLHAKDPHTNNLFNLPRIELSAGYARATQIVGCL